MKHLAHRAKTTAIAFAMTWLVLTPVQSADIDLFTTAGGQVAPPNVYVMIDNSANWNANLGGTTKRILEHAALKSVFVDDPDLAGTEGSTTDPIRINLGFGVFSAGNSPRGGKVVSAIEPLDSTYQSELGALFYDAGGNENLPGTNNAPYALSFNEAIAYFSGEMPVSGTQDGDHDPDAIAADGSYQIPVETNTCGKNYVILIGNGEPDSGEDNPAEDRLDERGGVLNSDPIETDPSNFESNWADEYARFMAGADVLPDDVRGNFEQNVRTYVIDVHNPNSNQANTNTFKAARAWLKSIAKWGDGRYFTASDQDEVAAALEAILDELFAVDSVFAATTLPVSVNVRGTNLNQVYMGVFRPSESDQTRWPGNLKLYQLAVDDATNTLFLADANEDRAQSPTTGFIVNDAESFWTHSSAYWDFDPRGEPPTGSDLPDGAVVEKGGAHQMIRDLHAGDTSGRPLFTRTSGSCTLLSGTSGRGCLMDDFDTGNASVNATTLGTADATETQLLVDWIHGENNATDGTDDDTKTTQTPRPSVHGDVLHSRPAVINYGDTDGDGESEVYVFYGANDGIFHALRGGKTGPDAGEEVWGFIPEEFFGKLKALRDRGTGKEYFADGGTATFQEDNDDDGIIETADGDRVYLYVAMRRGGRSIYALNVSDPDDPRYMWRITNDTAGFSELGQTWSQPDVSKIRYQDALGNTVTEDVLVFGGGYDPDADDPSATAARSRGRAIFVVDAEDGSLMWSAGSSDSTDTHDVTPGDMDYSIPSDVTVIDSDGDGFDDRVYVGDTGGQVWRTDISGPPSGWAVNKLASVGAAAGLEERKFLFPPDVVFTDEGFHAVLLGSGDRADPFNTSVTNRFYMFKDTETGLSVPPNWKAIEESDLFDATDNLIQVGTETEQSVAQSELDSARGWMLSMVAGGADKGEKVVSSAVTLGGAVFFNTNEPPDGAADCGQSLGIARFYEVDYLTGASILENNNVEGLQTDDRYSEGAGGGFPPSPVPVIVEIDGQKYQAVISGTETADPPGAGLERRSPVYWNTNIDN